MDAKLAKRLVSGLKEAGIDFVAYLPESRLSQILPLMRDDPSFQLAPVASEAEAVTIAAGAVLGGKQAACYIESTGIYVSCYSLVTVGRQLGVPLLLLVGFLGGFGDQRNSFLYATIGAHAAPVLDALAIPHEVIENGAGLETKINNAVRAANALRGPAALVFAGEFTL
jgi:sulfopyruvate decarboxylase TPP-binding subunit